MDDPVMTWDDIAEFISHLTPKQRKKAATCWDANNDAAFTINAASVYGKEPDDEIRPSDDFVSKGEPYLVYCL